MWEHGWALHAEWRNACSNQFSRWTPRLRGVSITVRMRATNRLTALLFAPKQNLRQNTAGRKVRRATLSVRSIPAFSRGPSDPFGDSERRRP